MRALCALGRWCSRIGTFSAAIVSAGCAFTLDFDKLERCGSCENVDSCGSSDHPCVQNGCHPIPKDNPACPSVAEEADAGIPRCASGERLSEYVIFEPVHADVVLQVEVLTTATHVYHAVYVDDDGARDVILRAFDTTGDVAGSPGAYRRPVATLRLSKLLEAALSNGPDAAPDQIVAPLTLAPTPANAGGLTLYTALAAPGAETGDVVQVRLDPVWPERATPTWLTDIPNFQIDDRAGRRGPAAGTLVNGEPFVVWQGCKPDASRAGIQLEKDLCKATGVTSGAGTIYGLVGSTRMDVSQLAAQGVAEDLPAGSIRALSGGNEPAAVWAVANLNDKEVQVKTGVLTLESSVATPLLQCDPEPGGAQWINSALVWGSISSVSWTKGSATAEATRVQCSDAACRDLAANADIDADGGAGADAGGDAGNTSRCTPQMTSRRVFSDVEYFVHGVWADSNADTNAYTVAAFVERKGSDRRLLAAVTQGLPDPNEQSLVTATAELELTTNKPTKVALSLQKYDRKARLAVAAVGWVEPTDGTRQVAHLSALDLCLSP